MATPSISFENSNNGILCVVDTSKVKTIKDLKSHIEQQCGIPSDEQIYVRHSEILYDAIHLEFLEVLPGEMQLHKKISPHESVACQISPELLEGGRLPDLVLNISADKCVSDLKLMIHKELGVPPSRQYLTSMEIQMNSELQLRDYIVERPPKFFLKETS